MVSITDIQKLARLSRLKLTEDEAAKLAGEMDSIIAYVDVLQKVELPETPEGSVYFSEENVMRSDDTAHAGGVYTDALLAQAPRREGNYLKVKKIIEQ